MFLKTFELFK